MRKVFAVILLTLFLSCSNSEKMILFDSPYYADEDVLIEYVMKEKDIKISVLNKTDKEIFLDFKRSSIISIKNQTKNLLLTAEDEHIPPNSIIFLKSNQDPIFFETLKYIPQKQTINNITGKESVLIRLYIPLKIGDTEKIYDIVLKAEGLTDFNQKTQETSKEVRKFEGHKTF